MVSAVVERCGIHSVAVSFDRRGEVDVLAGDLDNPSGSQP